MPKVEVYEKVEGSNLSKKNTTDDVFPRVSTNSFQNNLGEKFSCLVFGILVFLGMKLKIYNLQGVQK